MKNLLIHKFGYSTHQNVKKLQYCVAKIDMLSCLIHCNQKSKIGNWRDDVVSETLYLYLYTCKHVLAQVMLMKCASPHCLTTSCTSHILVSHFFAQTHINIEAIFRCERDME